MPLTTVADINAYLPEDKVVADNTNVSKIDNAITRTIKGYLSGIFVPTVLADWTDENDTPATIQDVYAKLAAAQLYAKAYTEDIVEDNNYATRLYMQAMSVLEGIRLGTVILPDISTDDMTVQTEFNSDMFRPNDSTTPGPMFTVSQEF